MPRILTLTMLLAFLAHPLDARPEAATSGPALGPGGCLTWRTLAILAAGGAGAAASWGHEDPDRMARNLDASFVEPVLDVGNLYGSAPVAGGGSAAVLLVGLATGSPGWRRTGGDLVRSYLASGAVTAVLKRAVDRRRPGGDSFSFPSGHTAAAFSTVPVLWQDVGWGAGALAAALATTTGLARMEDRRHYLSDVLFGAAIGLAAGEAVIRWRGGREGAGKLSLGPGGVFYLARF